MIPHELYTPREAYYDIALLLLERPVKFYNHIWPACLPNSLAKVSVREVFAISGWKKNGKKVNTMVKKELSPVENLSCQRFYEDKKFAILLPDGITDDLFCANNSACEGKQNAFKSD